MAERATRQNLIEAAIRVVSTSGLRGLTHRAIAVEAGAAHGLVRHYFGTVDELLVEAMQVVVTRLIAAGGLNSRSITIATFSRGLESTAKDNPDDQAFVSEMVLEARRQPALRPIVEAMYDNFRATLKQQLEQRGMVVDETLAALVFATLDGLIFEQQALGRPLETQRAIRRLHQILEKIRDAQA
jgi:DNA-binding transcriptional regulator YbjK